MSHLTWWSVFLLVLSAAIAFLAGTFLGRWLHRLIYRLSLTVKHAGDDRLVVRLRGAIVAIAIVAVWQAITGVIGLPDDVLAFAHEAGGIAFLVALAWLGLRLLDGVTELVAARSGWISAHRVSQSLLPLARRIAKVVLVVVVVMMILSELGYAIGPLIAGLGITGIAVALAAQKTLENVFGAFAIGVDHPFHEGDFVRLDNGLLGTVEQIGLRSTRIRTLDRTIATVPNGKLSEAQVEALTARDRMRFATTFHLALGASVDQLERVITDLEQMLAAHPRRAPENPQVHLVAVADAWFELEVMVWLETTSWQDFQVLRDRLFLRCLELIAATGITLHNAPAPTPPRTGKPEVLAGEPGAEPVRRASAHVQTKRISSF